MRGYAPLFLLAAAATAAPAPHDHQEAPKHSAGTCAPVSTNSTVELKAAVSSLLSNTKATGSFPDALSALLANGAANGTANAVPAESGFSKLYDGSDPSTDATTPDDSTSTDTDATSSDDSTSSDGSTAPAGADSSSSDESGQQVPAAASGRLDAIKKAAEKLRGSHEASGGASADGSGDAPGGASGSASGDASGDAAGDVSSGAPKGPPSRHLPSAKDLKEGASVAVHGADAVAAGAKAAGAIEHDVNAASGRSGGEGGGPLGGLRRHHGPFGGIGKRQAASSLEDVVGMDLNKLSEEQLKELDGENVAERDVTHPTNGGPITARDAAPTPVAAAHAFNKGDLKNGGDPLIWMVSEHISRVRKREPQTTGWIEEREAAPQTTGWIEEREAEPQTTAWIEEREAVPTQLYTSTLLRARAADAANDWDGPAPTPGGVQVWPEPEFISGIIGRAVAEPTSKEPAITAREAAPQDTANLGLWLPGKREAAPTGFYTSTLLRVRDEPATPPTYGGPTPVVKARDDIHLDPRPPPTYGGPGRRDVANDEGEVHVHLDPRPPPTYGGPGRRAIDIDNDKNEDDSVPKGTMTDPKITARAADANAVTITPVAAWTTPPGGKWVTRR